MPSRPEAALDDLAEEFDLFDDDWEERWRHVIDLGKGLEPLSEAEHVDANKVRGCASQVWLVSSRDADGRLVLRGDSDAHMVKGLVAVVVRLFGGAQPQEIAAFDAPAAFARLGLSGALSAQRANGLAAMVARIREEAAAAAA